MESIPKPLHAAFLGSTPMVLGQPDREMLKDIETSPNPYLPATHGKISHVLELRLQSVSDGNAR